jgi:hypothetical protein
MEIENILETFQGDLACLGFYSYLCTAYNSITRRNLSMRKLSLQTGCSLRKIRIYLSRLERMNYIECYIKPCSGVSVRIREEKLVSFGISKAGQNKLLSNEINLHTKIEPKKAQVYTWLA